MGDIINFNRELARYRSLKDNLSVAITNLDKSILMLEDSAVNVGSHFTIDEERADAGQILDCNEIMRSRRNVFKNIVIPAIDGEINRLLRVIELMEAQSSS